MFSGKDNSPAFGAVESLLDHGEVTGQERVEQPSLGHNHLLAPPPPRRVAAQAQVSDDHHTPAPMSDL